MTREDVRAALTDSQALVCTLYGEASGEPVQSRIAVGCAIRNRVHADLGNDGKADWWGESFKGVCLAKLQFSCWWETNANSDRVYRLAEDLMSDRLGDDAFSVNELRWIADGLISEALRDVTLGSTHYLTKSLFRAAPPRWARERIPTIVIGSHVFFAGVES